MNISEEKKFCLLEKIEKQEQLSKEDESTLWLLAADEEAIIRCRVAEILVFFPTSFSRKVLIDLSKDENELVRVDACDSLCVFGDKKVVKLLMERLIHDESELVRSYAALSLGSIAYKFKISVPEIISQLIIRFKVESSEHITTSILRSLYLNDRKDEYLCHLLDRLSNEHYYIRSAVVRSLQETCTDANRQIIVDALVSLLEHEEAYAVTFKIESVLEEISKNQLYYKL